MRRTGKKLLALCLTALLILGLLPTPALAVGIREARANESRAIKSGYIPVDLAGGRAISDAYERGDMETVNKLSPHKTRAALPSSYDSRNYGYITSVKNQNPYGTCWTFGTMAPIEAYMIKHGIVNNDTGAAATTSMDLSEYHLAWFNYTNAYDKLGMLTGDSSKPVGSTFLDLGGNGAMATFTLMRWAGPASEATSALKYSNASTSGLNSQYAYNYNVAHVTDVTWIPTANRNAVKEAIMEYGAATISYYHADTYLNSSTGAYCFKQSAAYGSNNYQYANHAVTVVGWDDNYSKSNFKSSYGPSSNGAWIIKNSWGSSWGKSGYFYLSYEDTASLNDTCYFYKVANLDNYTNCYQYDGTNNLTNYQSMGNNCQIANVFTANGSESLKAVAIAPWDEATTYTLKIYKNPTTGNPSSGTLMTTQNGYFEYSGYFTIPLDNPVALSAGDTFSVVFTLSTPSTDPDDGKYVHIPYDATNKISWAEWTHANHGNSSYYKEANGSWTDVPNNGDFRIKAYTNNASYTVTAVSNNTAYGTVSVNGNKITATPKSGYYVSDAQVTSGTATVSINGNVITVNASSNCTVKVIFSVKPQLTVNFKACGASVGSQTAYINDSITLPTTATAVNGYSFVGWTDAQVSETTDKPNYYAPGAAYVVTANTTLYALYARTENGGEIIYKIVVEPITDWTGKYVITSGKDTGMYVLKGISGNTSYQSASAGGTVTFASSGMTLDNGVLKNVGSAYVFQAEAAGTGYSLKNASTGTYLGSYNSYLYSLSSYYSSYCVWGLEYDTYNICMKVSNYASSSYPYMVKGPNAYFVMNSGYTTNKTQLWKQTTASTTYYNTNPSAASHTHTAGTRVQENLVAATCTAAGSYDEVVYCTACGKEMSRTHKTIAALGHNPGSSVQENYVAPTATTVGGYDTVVYCTRCNAELSREHTTLPATGVNTTITIDTDPTGGYQGDYVVIYNPATSSSTSYSTGTMTGLIQTSVGTNSNVSARKAVRNEDRPFSIDVDPMMAEAAKTAKVTEPVPTRASYSVGSTKTFNIYSTYSPTGSGSVQFKCLYVGQHCYIWTPTSSSNNTYPLDTIDSSFAKKAADEFDSKFSLMQSSFGNHTNGSSGDGKLHMLYYNINDGWQPGQGYIAGFFYQVDISNNGLPILNIDTYPGVYYKNSSGTEYKSMDATYNTMVHEYQHLINYSNTSGMSTWLNECFSAAAEEICYPGSSVVGRIQSWEDYNYSDNNDWLNPPAEFAYNSSFNLHKGYSMYSWDNNLSDILALYAQVSLFAQYLYSRFDNTIYRQISNKFSSSEVSAITSATGVNCADLVRDFRVAVTANAAQNQYNGIYGFKVQNGYDPSKYHNVQNPYSLLSPVVFTGSSCSIKGGGSITVKPVNGVYNPPSGASSNLKYIGIKFGSAAPNYTVTATSNNTSYGTVSVSGNVITASPKAGYYAASYTVTSGTATVTQNGNTFTVNPSSNCTVRINFAAKTQYTVTLKANGSTYNTLSCYSGESVTLPTTATSVSGYTFAGWTTGTVAETTTRPTILTGSYTPSGNVTLYAVYTRTSGGTGAVSYQLVSSTPSSWAGNYVITNGNSTSMYVLKGVTPSSNGAQIEDANNATAYSNTGMSLSNNTLTNVSNAYVFTLAATGSYYTVKSTSTGAYMGTTSSSYLAGYTSYNSSYCRWTPAVNSSGAAQLKNYANGSYPYFGFNTSSKYFWSASSSNANVLRLWKQTNSGTTYYTTSPSASTPEPETTYTVNFSVPSGISAPASQTVTAGGTITLPTAAAPAGYTFLGWVTSTVNNATTQPTTYTGNVTVNSNVTLYALYSYTSTSGGSGTAYEFLQSAPSDWTGSYVISYGTNISSLYMLKGLSGNASYESSSNGGAVLYSNTGMTYADGQLTGVSDAYVFEIASTGSKYTIRNKSTGTYLGSYNSYLYSRSSYSSSYCQWNLAISNGNATISNSASSRYPYLAFSSSNYFMVGSSAPTGLYLWKLTTTGGSTTTYYTT